MTELLEARRVTVEFSGGRGSAAVRAVDGVDLTIGARETVGLVGESGSGKSTLGRVILGLVGVDEGTVLFDGRDITRAGARGRRRLSRELQAVFQDPYGSLNPTRTIGQTLAEPLRAHGRPSRSEADALVAGMLARVGLPADVARRYPGQLSGGQRQRVCIARALMTGPRLVICDEAVSALDVSVQAQVLNLLRGLQDDLGLSYLFISHDLAVVRHVAHRIVVLYRGRVMEQGDAAAVYDRPAHPYTQALLAAAPHPDPEVQRRRRAARARRLVDASAAARTAACPFAARCPHALEVCRTRRPELAVTPEGSLVACHRWEELRAGGRVASAGLGA